MEDLFPETKIRRKPRVMMHVYDAGCFPSGDPCIHFVCPKCEFETGMIHDEWGVAKNKRGHPCPVCNPPAVHNKRANTAPYNAVYVGRGSLWGNPYQIGENGSREEVIELFRRNVLPRLDLAPLVGKHLVCYCAPAACHADLLLEEAAKLRCSHKDCSGAVVANLDGDNLCKEHADQWCRGEAQFAAENQEIIEQEGYAALGYFLDGEDA